MFRPLAALWLAAAGQAAAAGPPDLALLVGCTKYHNSPEIEPLDGPANDVKLWAGLLTGNFGFPAENVTKLVGWPDDPALRPTAANIAKAFARLIGRAEKGSRVVIVLSGHGIQSPLPDGSDPLAAGNPEPDGFDEMFLPADVVGWDGGGFRNGLVDNQIGTYLRGLRAKGAHVFVVFDSCHSGTMTRGTPAGEKSRSADPAKLSKPIPPALLKRAAESARRAVDRARAQGRGVPAERLVAPGGKGGGSVVAFFAARPDETAPELPLPPGAEHKPENRHGMLCYTVARALSGRTEPLTYRDLERLVKANYRAWRSFRPPTPSAEGDLNRPVLGLKKWPAPPIKLLGGATPSVNAGQVAGVTAGSVLAVRDGRDGRTVGRVRVTDAGPFAARVEAVTHDGKTINLTSVPDGSVCEVVSRDLGDLKLKLFADGLARQALRETPLPLARLVKEGEADWVLRSAVAGPELAAGKTAPAVAKYAAGDVGDRLPADLLRLYKWAGLWRAADAAAGGPTYGLKLTVLKRASGRDGGTPTGEAEFSDGQRLTFTATNAGDKPLWVWAFYTGPTYSITKLYAGRVRPGETATLRKSKVSTRDGRSAGRAGLVVIAVPAGQGGAPDGRFVALPQLAVGSAGRRGADKSIPDSPLGRLIGVAGGSRSVPTAGPAAPAILTRCWTEVPRRLTPMEAPK